MQNERGLSKTNNLLFLLKETEQVYQSRVKNDHSVCCLPLPGHKRDGFPQRELKRVRVLSLSHTLHVQDPLLKRERAAWSPEWELTRYEMMKLRLMLSKYQNAQVKQYVMLTRQNINKISNKINWILRFFCYCALNHHTVYHRCQHYAFPSQSESISALSQSFVLKYKACTESEDSTGGDVWTTKRVHVATGCREHGLHLSAHAFKVSLYIKTKCSKIRGFPREWVGAKWLDSSRMRLT